MGLDFEARFSYNPQMAERNLIYSLMDQWDKHEQEIAQLKERADEDLQALLQRLSQWVDTQRGLSIKTERGIERWATPGTTAFFYEAPNPSGTDTDLIVNMNIYEENVDSEEDDEDDSESNYEKVVINELRDRKPTDRPTIWPGETWRFVSNTEFRYTGGSLETVDMMRQATNAIKHSTSINEFRISGGEEDTYGYYEPARYRENAFVRRRHNNLLNRVDPLQEANRVLDLLYNARLVGRTVDRSRVEEPIEVIQQP